MINDDFKDIAKRLAELKKEPPKPDPEIVFQQADYFAQVQQKANERDRS
jgi:hypothetical protein